MYSLKKNKYFDVPCFWASFWSPHTVMLWVGIKKCNNVNRLGQMYSYNTRGPLWQRESHPDLPLLCSLISFLFSSFSLMTSIFPLSASLNWTFNDNNWTDNYCAIINNTSFAIFKKYTPCSSCPWFIIHSLMSVISALMKRSVV